MGKNVLWNKKVSCPARILLTLKFIKVEEKIFDHMIKAIKPLVLTICLLSNTKVSRGGARKITHTQYGQYRSAPSSPVSRS
jgi:hypothetical protein